MKRREFIAQFGSAAATWPLAAHAQQADGLKRVAVMVGPPESDRDGQARIKAFQQVLQELGWLEGRNIQIEYRWASGEPDRARTHATELVALAPDLIVANGTPALAALHAATHIIPVVFVVVVDPVGAGYIQSLSRPGGNITGFSTFEPEMGTKWLELLKEIAPRLRRVAVISDPNFKGFAALGRAIENMSPRFGLEPTRVVFHQISDKIEPAFATFAEQPDGGLIVIPTAVNTNNRSRIIALAAQHRLPAVYPFRYYATDGGLMCYGFDSTDLWRRGAVYVSRILNGEAPANLPVQTPNRFELILNLKTAKALDLAIPPTLLARADELIE
jgi:putative tryptophan/tyrosine transport system substrate-binding protein